MCFCGSERDFSQCCKPYLQGKAAPTAQALMRSRYTAYVKRDGAYLHRTWSVATRPSQSSLNQLPPTQWTGLTVIRTEAGDISDSTGIVEFIAHWQESDRTEHQLHEISQFAREKGRWVYVKACSF
jgi:SEC-C motif-containing protein